MGKCSESRWPTYVPYVDALGHIWEDIEHCNCPLTLATELLKLDTLRCELNSRVGKIQKLSLGAGATGNEILY